LTTRETGLLDSGSHAGWELAKALLRERIIDKNRVSVKIIVRKSCAVFLFF
jgi:hypothetical protein